MDNSTFALWISVIAAITAIVGTAAKIADMSDEGQARLRVWSTHLRVWVSWTFIVVGFANGAFGILLFFLSNEVATRGAIGSLLLLMFSCWATLDFAADRLRQRRSNQRIHPAGRPLEHLHD